MAIEPNTNQTRAVKKAQARPNYVQVGFVVLALVTLIALGWLLFGPLSVELPEETLEIQGVEDLRNYFWALGMVVAGGVAIWGLALAVVRTRALHRQANVAEKRHDAEAFTEAIEQLGKDNFAVRLGAVYALEALAKSSLELHGPIFETLCAYVRREAPGEELGDVPKPVDLSDFTEGQAFEKAVQALHPPDIVVQAILTVIGRRDPNRDPRDGLIDLRGTNLRRADLRRAHLKTALLTHAHLEGANLHSALCDQADFSFAHLERAILIGSTLNHTALWSADLSHAYLSSSDIKHAMLWDTNLERVSFMNANLSGAKLLNARLNGAILRDVSFDSSTVVEEANFTGAIKIPAKPGQDFRAIVQGADDAIWPADDAPGAWDRGGDGDDDGAET